MYLFVTYMQDISTFIYTYIRCVDVQDSKCSFFSPDGCGYVNLL